MLLVEEATRLKISTKTRIYVVTAALLIIAQKWKKPKCPSADA